MNSPIHGKKLTWYEIVQFIILLFTMIIMLSKHYTIFENLFSYLPYVVFGWCSFIFGLFSVLHSFYMLFHSFNKGNYGGVKVNWREIIEAVVVFSSGIVLLSPVFNTVVFISVISFMNHIHHDVISHLAFGLLPILVLYLIDMFRVNGTD